MEMTTGTQRAGMGAAVRPGAMVVQRLRDYVTLTKPHIISLLLITTVSPMVVAERGWPDGWTVLWTMLGGYLMAGSANATNMFIDRDIDAVMGRTRLRPIPSGRLSPVHVLIFALVLGAAAFVLFATRVHLLAAVLSLCGWAWYVGVYTLGLKRRSPQNIVIGGAAGAFPVLVGWAAVAGELSATAWALFLVVFLWTPPHFWALALVKQMDYGRVGVPMAPNVWGEERTTRQMVWYAAALVSISLAPVALGTLSWVYAALALGLGGWYLHAVMRVRHAEVITQPAWAAYRASLLYLALLFGSMSLDRVIWS